MATTINVILADSTTAITVSTGARGPAGTSAANSVTSATTSDGTAALYLDSIRFETTNGGPTQLGEIAWESTDGSIDAQLENGVIAAFAEDGLIRVRNTSGVPIAKGDALRFIGTNGATGRLEVAKWVGANVSNAKTFMGFAACAMNDNSNGYAQWFGKLEGINTTGGGEAWIDGQIIYAVPGASATITDTAPTAAGEYVVAAAVINAGSGTSGSMFVRPSFAKNIASADITDASSLGSESTAGKAALYGIEGELAAAYLFAGDNFDYATYFNDRIEVPIVGGAVEMNFPTTGNGTLMLNSNNLSDLTSASTARTNLGLGSAADLRSILGIQVKAGTSTGLSSVGVTDITGLTGFTLEADTTYKLELHYLWTSTSSNFQIEFVTTGSFYRGGTTPAVGQAMTNSAAFTTSYLVNNTTLLLRGSVGESRTNMPHFGYAVFKTNTSGTGKLQLNLLSGSTLSTITSSVAMLTKMS